MIKARALRHVAAAGRGCRWAQPTEVETEPFAGVRLTPTSGRPNMRLAHATLCQSRTRWRSRQRPCAFHPRASNRATRFTTRTLEEPVDPLRPPKAQQSPRRPHTPHNRTRAIHDQSPSVLIDTHATAIPSSHSNATAPSAAPECCCYAAKHVKPVRSCAARQSMLVMP